MKFIVLWTTFLSAVLLCVSVLFLTERDMWTRDVRVVGPSELSSLLLLQRVVDENCVESLMLMLDRNGIPYRNLRLGKRHVNLHQRDVYTVGRAKSIKSGGEDYCVVIASQHADKLGREAIIERVFVFDKDGVCIHSTPCCCGASLRDNQVFVRTLGSAHFWFVFEIERVGIVDELTLPSRQTILLVCPDMSRLLVVSMQFNTFSYTATPEHVEAIGGKVTLAFSAENDLPVTDHAGGKIEPVIEWTEALREFHGPSEGFFGGKLIFSVDIVNSLGFVDTAMKN